MKCQKSTLTRNQRTVTPAARPLSGAARLHASPAQHALSNAAAVCSLRRESKRAQLQTVCAAVADAPRVSQPNSKSSATKKVVVITGASSGLGFSAARQLAASGEWQVIMAVRDYSKAASKAKAAGMPKENYTIMHLDLASLDSVRDFVDNFRRSGLPLDVLVCNAAVYLPTAKEPTYTADGFELSVGTNHLGHFLLANLLLEDMKQNTASANRRVIIVGSITGNTNTLAGNIPPKANLGDMSGLATGLDGSKTSMIDGGEFDGAKAYKDSKVCNMLTMREFNRRFADTGITFSSLYPGCIATTGLFRSHVKLFQVLFPLFQQYVTKGFVSEEEAGRRLMQVVADPTMSQSGVYWSWDNDTGAFKNQVSEEVSDDAKGRALWEVSEKLVGLA